MGGRRGLISGLDGRGHQRAGFAKIIGCCAQAALDEFQYVWIDTCCIDKTSSAELSEAINSMYMWYRNATVCYAYLSDTTNAVRHKAVGHFSESMWFTRGWTLQELLAPSTVIFYDRDWYEIGTKFSLSEDITSITGIRSLANVDEACVAGKISWASRRKTTREEDMAYCLMGHFGVHMAPLYGEGQNAFLRLQLEILSKNDDESIFAWGNESGGEAGLLATSLKAFEHSGNVRSFQFDPNRPQYSMTNKGLRLELPLISLKNLPAVPEPTATDVLARLNCFRLRSNESTINFPLVIRLERIHQNQYSVVRTDDLHLWQSARDGEAEALLGLAKLKTVVYVKQQAHPQLYQRIRTAEKHVFRVKIGQIRGREARISEILRSCSTCNVWHNDNTFTMLERHSYTCCNGNQFGAMLVSHVGLSEFAVVIELIDHQPIAGILFVRNHESLRDAIRYYSRDTAGDRVIKNTQEGWGVSLALRTMSRQRYRVDISVAKGRHFT